MARHKRIDTSPKFLPVDPSRQLLPGTFENAISVKVHVSNEKIKRSGQIVGPHL